MKRQARRLSYFAILKTKGDDRPRREAGDTDEMTGNRGKAHRSAESSIKVAMLDADNV